MSKQVMVVLSITVAIFLGLGQCKNTDLNKELEMNDVCQEIMNGTTLTGVLEEANGARWLHIRFINQTQYPLWIPQEKEPAYRVDTNARSITISYGFFEEVYGPYKSQYMLPPMQMVLPNQQHSWKITSSAFVAKVLTSEFRTYLQTRLALQPFKESRVRGAQELDAYLKKSCIIKSSEFSLKRK